MNLNILDFNVSVLFLIAFLALTFYLFLCRRADLPPGPYGLPFVGIYPFLSGQPHVYLMKLAEKYGDVFSFTLFRRTYIHLNSLDVIKEAFIRRADVFSGRDTEFNLLNYVDDVQGIAQTEGEEWKEIRKFFLQNVKRFGFGKTEIESDIHNAAMKVIMELYETKGKPISASHALSIAAMNVVGKIFMSLEYDGLDDIEFIRVQRNAFSFVKEFDTPRMLLSGPMYKYLFFCLSKNYQNYVETKKAWYSASEKVINDHIKFFNENGIRDFTDRWLEVMHDRQQGGEDCRNLTIERLRAILINIYLDGMMTLAAALECLLHVLAVNEDVQDKVKEEIDSVVGNERLPSWSDRSHLPYTQATLTELHRLNPVLPLSVSHKCTETVQFRGYLIPKGSIVLSNIWAVHYNPETFPNPYKCDPSRYLSKEGRELQKSVISFGIGHRSCVGKFLAEMEIFIYITSILQKFRIALPPGVTKEDLKAKKVCEVCFLPRDCMESS